MKKKQRKWKIAPRVISKIWCQWTRPHVWRNM